MKTWLKIIGLVIFFMIVPELLSIITFPIFLSILNLPFVPVNLLNDGVTFIVLVAIVLWRRRRLTEPIYLNKPKTSVLLLTIPLALAMNFFSGYLMELLPLAEEQKAIEEMFKPFVQAPLWMGTLYFGVFAALNEELLLRGLIYHELRRKMSVIVAVIIQGVLFGIMHANIYQLIYTSLMGIIIGLVYVWTRSIWVTMSIHFVNNFYSLIITKYTTFKLTGSILYLAISLLMILVFLIWIYRAEHRRPA
jgi:membrane protease YdiL (CAAX protease family)